MRLGFIYILKEEYKKAIGALNKAIQLNPDIAESYNNRGFAYLKPCEMLYC